MTTLEKIVKKAQALKKSYPNKFAKWTDYVKEASKEFRSTTTTAKKKSKLGTIKFKNYIEFYNKKKNYKKDIKKFKDYNQAVSWGKQNLENFNLDMVKFNSKLGAIPVGFQATFRGNPFYLTNQYDIFNNISLEVTDKKTNEVFAVIDKNSKTDLITDQFIIWLNSKGVNTDSERDLKSLHKEIKPLAVNLLQEVKAFNKGKKKAPIKTATKKKAPKKVVSKKLTSKKASDLIRAEVKSKKFIMPHGYEVRKSKLAGNSKKYLLKLADDYAYATSGNLDRAIYNLLDPEYTKTLIPKYKKAIKDWEIKNKTKISGNNLAGSKITPAEHYLSYAPPSKPSEQQIYKGIERVKQDILRLQGMQKDHMFKKHKASLNGAINTKNREIKELLNKLK
jgi:hypothetical protein